MKTLQQAERDMLQETRRRPYSAIEKVKIVNHTMNYNSKDDLEDYLK